MLKSLLSFAAIAAAALMVSSCSNSDPSNIPLAQFAGLAQNTSGKAASATVTARKIINGQISNNVGDVFQSSTAGTGGAFSYSFLGYVGPIHLEVNTTPPMTAAFASIPAGQTTALTITPFTSLVTAAALSSGSISAATLMSAEIRISQNWLGNKIDLFSNRPLDPATANDPNAASQAEKFYYFLLGGMNLLWSDLALANAGELESKMLQDASDGVFDGMDTGGAIAGITATTFTSDLAARVTTFAGTTSVTYDATAFGEFTNAITNFNGTLITG